MRINYFIGYVCVPCVCAHAHSHPHAQAYPHAQACMSNQFSLCSVPVMSGIDAEPLWKQVADEQIARKKNIKACNIS